MMLNQTELLHLQSNQEKFIGLICQHVALNHLELAVAKAKDSYCRAKNVGTVSGMLLSYFSRWRRAACMDLYIESYNAQKSDDPRRNLLILLLGPHESRSVVQGEGGVSIDSFKWLVLQELSVIMPTHGLIRVRQTYGYEYNDELDTYVHMQYLTDNETSQMIAHAIAILKKDYPGLFLKHEHVKEVELSERNGSKSSIL